MTGIDFDLTPKQKFLRESLRSLATHVIRPMSLKMDREKQVPESFLRSFVQMAAQARQNVGDIEENGAQPSRDKPSQANRTAVIAAEELAYGDPVVLMSLPGPGLGGPPVRATGTPEQKKRFLGMFDDMLEGELKWAAYGLTEPSAGSDVAGIRTSCRKDGNHYILNGRKCFITNGARASWTVIFATIDPSLGRAGHRAFVVEKGTPGFSVGKIEDKMGLRASETAELLLEDCRVPADNLLGGEGHYRSKEGFLTAMKTFDHTRPMVGAMAIGIGRAAYEYARDFVKENYLLSRPIPRYAAIVERLARVHRNLEAARMLIWRAVYLADIGQPNAMEAAMAKAAAGQAAIRACIEAIEICGAHGALQSEHALVEKWFRDIKVFDIFEGTGQIQRIVISKRLIEGLKGF